jgi:hypothetical protein
MNISFEALSIQHAPKEPMHTYSIACKWEIRKLDLSIFEQNTKASKLSINGIVGSKIQW